MDTSTKYVVGIVVIIVIALGAWALMKPAAPVATDTQADMSTTTDMGSMDMGTETTSTTATSVTVAAPAPGAVTVTYDGSSFSPKSVTVKAGQSVTFVDSSSQPLWVASDPHPSHTEYDSTSRDQHCAAGYAGAAPFDECTSAASYTFTFGKVGSWGYHNHLNPGATGTVVVTQ